MQIFTPSHINSKTDLPSNARIFVGTNTEGRHGKGAALMARNHFGLKYGVSKGPSGQSYGIVTKDLKLGMRSIPLCDIYEQLIDAFIYAADHGEELCYFVKLGSSLAGYSIEEIKGLFKRINEEAFIPKNVILPKEYEVRY